MKTIRAIKIGWAAFYVTVAFFSGLLIASVVLEVIVLNLMKRNDDLQYQIATLEVRAQAAEQARFDQWAGRYIILDPAGFGDAIVSAKQRQEEYWRTGK